MRLVKKVYNAVGQHWVGNGFLVQPLFSHMGENRGTDPFLMLDYAVPKEFAPNANQPRGVGQHPHKGFETVTLAIQGSVAHRDSAGGGGVIHAGDVQWMTAGSGIIHDEFHSEEFSKTGGMFEMLQLWVNLPAKDKNTTPHYQHLANNDIPVVQFANGAGQARIIAGQFEDQAGAAKTYTELNMWDITINANASVQLEVPATHSLSLVVLRGNTKINRLDSAKAGQLVSFERGDGMVKVQAGAEEVRMVLLSGVPIDEPIAAYGPFVMNTDAEIREAFMDFQAGRFGQIAH